MPKISIHLRKYAESVEGFQLFISCTHILDIPYTICCHFVIGE